MTTWYDKTETASLSGGDKVMVEQGGVTKTADIDTLTAQVEGSNKATVFGYSMPDTKVFTLADTWYKLEGTFTNEIVNNFSAGTTGIVFDGEGSQDLEAEYMIGGIADDDCIIKIALVKNGTFDGTTGALTAGSVLPGSGGGAEAVVIAGSKGFVNARAFWAGELTNGDEITIVYSCDEAGTTFVPDGSSATIHRSS